MNKTSNSGKTSYKFPIGGFYEKEIITNNYNIMGSCIRKNDFI